MPCILDNVGTILQARRQEMKWGVCLKKWKMGVFCKKVKNEECFFVKKWTFPQRRVHYVQYQCFFYIILHFTYLGGGA